MKTLLMLLPVVAILGIAFGIFADDGKEAFVSIMVGVLAFAMFMIALNYDNTQRMDQCSSVGGDIQMGECYRDGKLIGI